MSTSYNNVIRPFYSMSQMAKYIQYKTNAGTQRFMRKLGIPIHLVGGKNIIYISDLQIYAPELFASMLEAAQLNEKINDGEKIELPPSEEEYMEDNSVLMRQFS